MTLPPLSARVALDQYYLEARAKLLDLAGILDRIDRGGDVSDDPRRQRLLAALDVLKSSAGRAVAVQELFSLAYDPAWERPVPQE